MSSLQMHREDGVVSLTLNRPEVHNAFDDELICGLTDTLKQLGDDPQTRAVVLTGNGKSFSAGADLNWMRGMLEASEEANVHDALQLARLLRTLNYLPVPTIARVNGAALGGGLGLVACCDIAIAVEDARFGLTETRLGLAPAIISPYVFRRIGEAQARRYFLTAERFDAAHARDIGLVHETVPNDVLDDTVTHFCAALSKSGPQAVSAAKQLVYHAAGHDAETQLKLDQTTARLIARMRIGAEGQEGMRAFLDKRLPAWRTTD
ncbi:MAG: enoyl-CoA hydratase-related protein [Pseudomonadota bacterium]